MKYIIKIILLLLLIGCNKHYNNSYTLDIVRKEGFGFINVPYPFIMNEYGNENGKIQFFLNDSLFLKEGTYKNGFPTGKWKYGIDSIIEIDWKIQKGDNGIELSIPTNWNSISHQDCSYLATFKKKEKLDSIINHDFFLIKKFNEKLFETEDSSRRLDKFKDIYISTIFNKFDGAAYKTYEIVCKSGNRFYMIIISYNNNNIEFCGISFLGKFKNELYELTLKKKGSLSMITYQEMLSIIRSLQIKGERFFNPFDKIIKLNNDEIEELK